jgi:hypothetical protein
MGPSLWFGTLCPAKRQADQTGVVMMTHPMTLVLRPIRLVADAVLSTEAASILAEVWFELKRSICDPYRPERHYMRGARRVPIDPRQR